MYKVKNISGKIIGIDGRTIIPDEEIVVNDKVVNESVMALVNMKMLYVSHIEDEKAPVVEHKEKVKDEAKAVGEPIVEAPVVKKRGRRPKSAVADESADIAE